MRLYVVRHSEPVPPETVEDDANVSGFDPPLTDLGREMVQALGAWMLDKDEVPNSILASPKLRTQETAEILRECFGLPQIETKQSLGPSMGITKMVQKVAQDASRTRVMLVSHHETIAHGLRVLNLDPNPHADMYAEAEMRIYKVSRKDGSWKEHRRVRPGELGYRDQY